MGSHAWTTGIFKAGQGETHGVEGTAKSVKKNPPLFSAGTWGALFSFLLKEETTL